MRALLLSQEFPPTVSGGIALYYYNLARTLGGALSVLTPAAREASAFDRQQPFAVHRRRMPTVTPRLARSRTRLPRTPRMAYIAASQWWSFYRGAVELVRRDGIDIVLLGHLYLAPLGRWLRRRSDAAYGVMLHGSELHRYLGRGPVRRLMVGALDDADLIVVNSDFTRRQYIELGVRADQRFVRVNPGVDVERFRPDAGDPQAVRRRLGLGERPTLASVARLVEWKGQDTVLRALSRIRRQVPDVAYVMVGDGPYRRELAALVAELGLEGDVIFAGHVPEDELPSYYRAADVVVVPSRDFIPGKPVEGFGMVYVEAGACGRPCIGGNAGGTEESIAEGVSGFRVDASDPAAVAAAALRLLRNPELARRMGEAGRERAVRLFDWSVQARRLLEGLESVAGQR